MNKKQYWLIARKILRKEIQRKASFDVIFNNLTPYQAERKYNCVPNTVERSVKTVQEHFEHCNNVINAK